MSASPEASPGLPTFRTALRPEWIDYNGHLRDAYYGLIMSLAIDDVMDHLGLDAGYRNLTHCTLYTLELHLHYLHEVKAGEDLTVASSVLDADRKRIHLGCRFLRGAATDPVAVGEVMLLHVSQAGAPASAPFPPEVERQLDLLKRAATVEPAWVHPSRRIELKRQRAPSQEAASPP